MPACLRQSVNKLYYNNKIAKIVLFSIAWSLTNGEVNYIFRTTTCGMDDKEIANIETEKNGATGLRWAAFLSLCIALQSPWFVGPLWAPLAYKKLFARELPYMTSAQKGGAGAVKNAPNLRTNHADLADREGEGVKRPA